MKNKQVKDKSKIIEKANTNCKAVVSVIIILNEEAHIFSRQYSQRLNIGSSCFRVNWNHCMKMEVMSNYCPKLTTHSQFKSMKMFLEIW
jgi:hypothetical protein